MKSKDTDEITIEKLEFKLLKSSVINDGDIILIKITDKEKLAMTNQKTQELYQQISNILNKKDLKMFFFPKHFEINLIKSFIQNNGIDDLEKNSIEDENYENE